MRIEGTPLPGVLVLEPKVHGDSRGFFVETFRDHWLGDAGITQRFVQDNQSRSGRGVLRGLHYQLEHPQGKLVRVARGSIFDVAVDVRAGSKTFGQWFGLELNDRDHRMLYVPPGYAHGFLVLSEVADLTYKCTDYYHAASEQGILWNDPDLAINWPDVGAPPLLSGKDAALPRLKDQARQNLPGA